MSTNADESAGSHVSSCEHSRGICAGYAKCARTKCHRYTELTLTLTHDGKLWCSETCVILHLQEEIERKARILLTSKMGFNGW